MAHFQIVEELCSTILRVLSKEADVSYSHLNGSSECRILGSDKFPTVILYYGQWIACSLTEEVGHPVVAHAESIVDDLPFKEVMLENEVCVPVSEVRENISDESVSDEREELQTNLILEIYDSGYSEVQVERVPAKKQYRCTYCTKTFKLPSEKVDHERTHTGEETLCSTNTKEAFLTNARKVIHEKIHARKRTYRCGYCPKTFQSKSQKTEHEETHKGEKKRYSCRYCSKTFLRIGKRKDHESLHKITKEKPFPCSYCSMKFSCTVQRAAHERTRIGDKSFQCTYCNKTFCNCFARAQHEREHTGSTPYSCQYCDRTFATSNKRHLHEERHLKNVNVVAVANALVNE